MCVRTSVYFQVSAHNFQCKILLKIVQKKTRNVNEIYFLLICKALSENAEEEVNLNAMTNFEVDKD